MKDDKPKMGRPSGMDHSAPIPTMPEKISRVRLFTPPKKYGEWEYMSRVQSEPTTRRRRANSYRNRNTARTRSVTFYKSHLRGRKARFVL